MATAGTALAASNNTAGVNAQIKSLQKQISQLQTKVNSINNAPARMSGVSNVLSLNANLSQQMLSNQSGVGREMNLLKARQMGGLPNQSLTLGGRVEADALYQHTGAAGYFSNPVANTSGSVTTGESATNTNVHTSSVGALSLSNVNLDSAVALNSWATGYVQLGGYNIGNGNAGYTNAAFQQAYLVFGNLAQNPVYGFVGKKEIDFGSFASTQPYMQPLTRIYFMPTGNTAGVGYSQYGMNLTGSVMNGSSSSTNELVSNGSIAQYKNLYTGNGNSINDWALNASYNAMTQGVNWTLGAGYLAGSQQGVAATGTPADGSGAWDVNGKASVNNFDLLAEYVSTVHSVASLNTANFSGSILRAWSLGGDYNFPVMGYKSVAALEYSKVGQGNSASNAYQYAASWSVQPVSNIWTGVTYAYNKGLVGGALSNTAYLPTSGGTGLNAVTTGSSAINNTVLLDVTAYF
jgi:hypothetical protein